MKTKILILAFILLESMNLNAQTTPRGNPVTSYQTPEIWSYQDKLDWGTAFAEAYPNATEQGTATTTNKYNCHSYAWNLSEGGDTCWIGYYSTTNEDIYWTDQSYIETTEAYASKISYYEDDHSARQTSTQGMYISKWGNKVLMLHARDYGPSSYQMSSRKYYRLNPEINGTFTSALCGDQERTFSSNMSITGSTYAWAKDDNRLDYVSGAGTTSYTIMAKTNVGGDAYLRLQITTPSGEVATSPYAYVWIGPPSIGYPQGPEGLPLGCITNYWINAQGYPTSYQWGMEGRVFCQPGEQWYYLSGENTSSATLFAGCQGRYIGVNVGNQCGTSYVNKFVDIGYYDCEGGMKMMIDSTLKATDNKSNGVLAIYPNPASNNVQVSVILPTRSTNNSGLSVVSNVQSISTTYSVKVFNIYGTLVYVKNKTVSPFNIPLNGLNDGNYIISVSDNINTFQGQLVVKH